MARSQRRIERESRYDPMPEPDGAARLILPPRQDCRRRDLPKGSRPLGDELWESPDGRMFYVT